ncbi:hypothetical protein [Cesiribacter andamanensis]|uniref:Beta-lactamase-inhibitor-like PepSY-like domain-containing protein n=1 Tax=Cesiribacter andamanensis AMV16 TaxID=1279009 RepID=M7N4F2_9BACT|nr:hypothetical protein [Cesiribacter andamanensis]EMR02172.1 hypothetical protein ADICEAN_02686 [Cesiribacter andamanensis AMV16]
MKKLSITLIIMLLVLGSALAQQKTKTNLPYQQIEPGVPQAVLDAVEKKHQGFHFQKELALLPRAKAKSKTPTATKVREQELEIAYTSYARRASANGKVRSVKRSYYDANGIFISSREVLTNKALPAVVRHTLKEYDGWELEKTRAVVEEKGALRTVYYSLTINNGKDRKRLLLSEDGLPLRNKKSQGMYALKAKR